MAIAAVIGIASVSSLVACTPDQPLTGVVNVLISGSESSDREVLVVISERSGQEVARQSLGAGSNIAFGGVSAGDVTVTIGDECTNVVTLLAHKAVTFTYDLDTDACEFTDQ